MSRYVCNACAEELGVGFEGNRKGMNMPLVVVDACWRKTVDVDSGFEAMVDGKGIWRMSIGMESRWQAKIEFMMGMYWCARSDEGEAVRRRIRDCSFVVVVEESVVVLLSGLLMPVVDSE